MVATIASGQHALSQRRAQLAGPSGVKGLLSNLRIFAIAVFASLGGFVYGYNQGMFGQILNMPSFSATVHPESISNPTLRGFLTAILELGAWVGVLINGVLADRLGRKLATFSGVIVFLLGVIVQACAKGPSYILGGRFVTGMGVGTLSMIVPLYNAELAPAELRGSLVSLQQLAITFGIMVSYWIGYGTNYIGGTGAHQSNAAWLVPICIQILPASVLVLVFYSCLLGIPRWLMTKGRDEESLAVISRIRSLPSENELVQLEYLEMKAQHRFEVETSIARFPQYQAPGLMNQFKLGFQQYVSLLTNRSLFKRVVVAVFIMVFQQWSGVNAILYYAAFIFKDLGLTGNTTSLLASGVGGILMFLATIPAVLYIDQLGRKPVLIAGAIGMGVSHIIVAALYGSFNKDWAAHRAAGWVAVVFVWIYEIHFGCSWGPGAWVVVAEIFPLGFRAKGISIGASSNWLNNFAIGQATPPMVSSMTYGTFIFFGLICFIGALFIYFAVPETKNLTLEEMDEVFGDEAGNAIEDRNRLVQIYTELGLLGDGVAEEKHVPGNETVEVEP
ncbi:uncharacterized protein N7477_004187 [Penicillium maclennaniae]|uniref:uncharacterized protein n=1 Tax=Penicillium maclennaniae TaxID=1343394 RepID=UPI002540D050|nr:uncharacterized protein N7477_004187 [Penicillium maclennaniae]KAJ5678554.1 hypothetical protein N7477_004187 [Penicillium maclennaniae]